MFCAVLFVDIRTLCPGNRPEKYILRILIQLIYIRHDDFIIMIAEINIKVLSYLFHKSLLDTFVDFYLFLYSYENVNDCYFNYLLDCLFKNINTKVDIHLTAHLIHV